MFPLKDENPTEITPVVTFVFIALNIAVWLFVQGAGTGQSFLASLCHYGAIPGSITGAIPAGELVPLGDEACRTEGRSWFTLLTSMFMHGGWMHLIGNMWFLWVFGNNIEDSMGHFRFIAFYLLTGLLAALAHVASAHASGIPVVGASGAISGIMGAYIVLYPRVRVQTLFVIVFFIRIVAMPAAVWLGLWFGLQLLWALMDRGGGVAFVAHIGGFVAGAALIKLFEKPKLVDAKRRHIKLERDQLDRWDRW